MSGCTCQGTPASLSATPVYSGGRSAATYSNQIQSSTLQWYTANVVGGAYDSGDHPAYLPTGISAYNSPGYYSTASWFDDFGQQCYYRLTCGLSQYTIGLGVYDGSNWQSPSPLRHYNIGAGSNACIPFNLATGFQPTGSGFIDNIIITG